MEDSRIIELFWERNENAINECNTKYNSWLKTISYNILTSHEEAELSICNRMYLLKDGKTCELPEVIFGKQLMERMK